MRIDKILDTKKKFFFKNTKDFVVVHHTGDKEWTFDEAMDIFANRVFPTVSTHYVLGRNGEVGKVGEHDDAQWHVGEGIDPRDGQKKNMNAHCIGIEVQSDGYNVTEEQKKKLPDLIRYICEEENISRDRVIRHADLSSYRGKWDITPLLYKEEYDTFREYIDGIFNYNEQERLRRHVGRKARGIWRFANDLNENKEEIQKLAKQIQKLV